VLIPLSHALFALYRGEIVEKADLSLARVSPAASPLRSNGQIVSAPLAATLDQAGDHVLGGALFYAALHENGAVTRAIVLASWDDGMEDVPEPRGGWGAELVPIDPGGERPWWVSDLLRHSESLDIRTVLCNGTWAVLDARGADGGGGFVVANLAASREAQCAIRAEGAFFPEFDLPIAADNGAGVAWAWMSGMVTYAPLCSYPGKGYVVPSGSDDVTLEKTGVRVIEYVVVLVECPEDPSRLEKAMVALVECIQDPSKWWYVPLDTTPVREQPTASSTRVTTASGTVGLQQYINKVMRSTLPDKVSSNDRGNRFRINLLEGSDERYLHSHLIRGRAYAVRSNNGGFALRIVSKLLTKPTARRSKRYVEKALLLLLLLLLLLRPRASATATPPVTTTTTAPGSYDYAGLAATATTAATN